MKKSFLTYAFGAFLAAFSLVACSSNDDPKPTPTPNYGVAVNFLEQNTKVYVITDSNLGTFFNSANGAFPLIDNNAASFMGSYLTDNNIKGTDWGVLKASMVKRNSNNIVDSIIKAQTTPAMILLEVNNVQKIKKHYKDSTYLHMKISGLLYNVPWGIIRNNINTGVAETSTASAINAQYNGVSNNVYFFYTNATGRKANVTLKSLGKGNETDTAKDKAYIVFVIRSNTSDFAIHSMTFGKENPQTL